MRENKRYLDAFIMHYIINTEGLVKNVFIKNDGLPHKLGRNMPYWSVQVHPLPRVCVSALHQAALWQASGSQS